MTIVSSWGVFFSNNFHKIFENHLRNFYAIIKYILLLVACFFENGTSPGFLSVSADVNLIFFCTKVRAAGRPPDANTFLIPFFYKTGFCLRKLRQQSDQHLSVAIATVLYR